MIPIRTYTFYFVIAKMLRGWYDVRINDLEDANMGVTPLRVAAVLWWRFTWRSVAALLALLAPWVLVSVIGMLTKNQGLISAPDRFMSPMLYVGLTIAYIAILRAYLMPRPPDIAGHRVAIALRGPLARFDKPPQSGSLSWGVVGALSIEMIVRQAVLVAAMTLVPVPSIHSPAVAEVISLCASFAAQFIVVASIVYAGALVRVSLAELTARRAAQ